jgi:hypothetical protein
MDPVVASTPAPAATTTSTADSSAAVPATAQVDAGGTSEQGGTPAPASEAPERVLSLPDPETDLDAYHQALSNLSDEDQDAFNEGRVEYKKADAKDDKPVEDKGLAVDGDDEPLTPAELSKLPPKVQKALERAQAMQDQHGEFAEFLKPEFQNELDSVLSDPRVQAVIDERKRGGQLSYDASQVLTPNTLNQLVSKAGVDLKSIDFLTDPEGSQAAILKVIGQAIEEGKAAGKIETAMTAKAEAAQKARENFYEKGFSGLQEKIPGLKSSLPLNDPKHPAYPFQEFLRQGIQKGHLTHEFIMDQGSLEPLFLMYQAKTGGIQSIINKPQANAKARFLAEAQKAATNEAVSAVGKRLGSNPTSGAIKHGVDGEEFLKMSQKQQSQVMDRYDDPSILEDFGNLLQNGRW